MHILLIDPSPELATSLERRGHTVTTLSLAGGMTHLPSLLSRQDICPDLLVQQEHLGRRAFLGGLEELPFPTMFWAIDTHLNMHWQRYYSLLFDAVLTPHVSLFAELPELLRPKSLHRFAQWGQERPWRDHAERKHALAFCARMDANRPLRICMVELLRQRCGLRNVEGLPFEDMMRLYDDARIIPNESIANEVNFRLMEGASSGCLVISPDVGPDQDALLTPGKEFLVWRDGLELLGHIAWAKAHPQDAEAMGKRARQRVMAEHLPEHRAGTLLRVAEQLSQHRLAGKEASLAFWLTQTRLIRNGLLDLEASVCVSHADAGVRLALSVLEVTGEESTAALPNTEVRAMLAQDAVAQAVHLYAEQSLPGSETKTVALCGSLLAQTPKSNMALAAVASAVALRQGNFTKARAFWAHVAVPTTAQCGDTVPLAQTPAALCLAWAAVLRRAGCKVQAGFPFSVVQGMLPECAHEYLLFARYLVPDDTAVERHLAELLKDLPSHIFLYLGHLADACLRDQRNWRLQFAFGLASLQVCRVEEGLQELTQAWNFAISAGRGKIFDAMLRAHCPSGYVQAALATTEDPHTLLESTE